GMEGGHALARILFGEVAPGGRLPSTWPRGAEQLPPLEPGASRVRYGPLHGYRLMEATGRSPAFPFGFGLTYTTFEHGRPVARRTADGGVRLTVPVTNTGTRAADEVVQVYLDEPLGSDPRPLRTLRAFRRVPVPPGATVEVTFELGPDVLARTAAAHGGVVRLHVGRDADPAGHRTVAAGGAAARRRGRASALAASLRRLPGPRRAVATVGRRAPQQPPGDVPHVHPGGRRDAVAGGQLLAQPVGDPAGDRRQQEHDEPERPQHRVDREARSAERRVGQEAHEADDEEGERGDAERRAHRSLAGPVEDVVLVVVAGDPGLEERPGVQQPEGDPRQQHAGEERVGDLEATGPELPPGHDPQGAVQPPHVPVGLA